MKTATTTIGWATQQGEPVAVTVMATAGVEEYTERINLDGHVDCVQKTRVIDDLVLVARVGEKVVGKGWLEPTRHPVAVSRIGKLGLNQANNDRVTEAIKDMRRQAREDEDFVAAMEKAEAKRQFDAEVDAFQKFMAQD